MKFPKLFGGKATVDPTSSEAELAALSALETMAEVAARPRDPAFETLVSFLAAIPGVRVLSQAHGAKGTGWWVKLRINIHSPFAWHVVQELGWVLNEVSISERLPTVFKPVSPPPYMNGGPGDYLSWVIECTSPEMEPDLVMKHLEARLPKPASALSSWEGLGE